jgi:hypothetical protein
MLRHPLLFGAEPARPEPACPACGASSRSLGRRGAVACYSCPVCGLLWDLHDPGAMTPPRKRGAGPRQARPSMNSIRSLTTHHADPRQGGLSHG